MSFPHGSRLGSYEIVGTIGAGGMGIVDRARDTRLRRDVGLKTWPAPRFPVHPASIYTARMWRALLLVYLAAAGPAAAHSSAAQASDEAAVRTVVRNYVNARELRDPAAIAALFTADADQHTTSGEWRRGRPEVIRGTMESSKRNPGTRRITVETVRFITRDVAIADGPYEISTDGNVRRMWTTIILRRERGAWRIAAIRNMAPTTSPAARQP